MNPLDKYHIRQGDWTIIKSPICSTACSLAHAPGFSKLEERINELVFAYFNQWRFVIEAYEKMYSAFSDLNSVSDQSSEESIFSQYDIKGLQLEVDFKNHSYLFIISIKSLLDLFAILTDIIQNQQIREEHKLPDFFKYGKKKNAENFIPEILDEFERLRKPAEKNWIVIIKELRDKIIHRGFLLKPQIGFKKTEELLVLSYRGNNFATGVDTINIGKLFEDLITGMPLIEEKMSSILIREVEALKKGHSYEASFQYSELTNVYDINEIGRNSS